MSAPAALAIMQEECDRGWRDPHLMAVFTDLVPTLPSEAEVPGGDLGEALFADVVHSGTPARVADEPR